MTTETKDALLAVADKLENHARSSWVWMDVREYLCYLASEIRKEVQCSTSSSP